MPSHNFFGTIEITWSYDSTKGELTVGGALNGKNMSGSPAVLTHTNNTSQFNGQDGNNSAQVGLAGNFSTLKLTMNASQTDPQKSNTNQSDF